jgi:hypothetical protein
MPPRLWQRQPGETPADFMAFVAAGNLIGLAGFPENKVRLKVLGRLPEKQRPPLLFR